MNKIINDAYRTNLFYSLRRKSSKRICNITELPVVSKEEIRDGYELLTNHINSIEDRENIIQSTTSGSTGMYLKVLWKKSDYFNSLFSVWFLRKKYYDIFPYSKLLYTFSGLYRDNNYERKKENVIIEDNRLGISTDVFNEHMLHEFYMIIEKFEPEWIIIQPSVGNILFECIEKFGKKPFEKIKYIEYTGEYLEKELIKKTKDILNCDVGNLYGLTEVNQIAFMCPYGNLHCMESNVYVEIINDDNENVPSGVEGEICVTSLTNTIMPFIRYKTGDRGRITDTYKCPCGNKGKTIQILRGRTSEYVILENGEKSSINIFFDVVQYINEEVGNCIKQFRIIQEKGDDYKVILVLNEGYFGWKDTIINSFLEQINTKGIKNAEWRFEFFSEYLPTLPSGKLSFFVQKKYDGPELL